MNPSLRPSTLQLFLCDVVLLASWRFLLIVHHELQKIQQRLADLCSESTAVLRRKKNELYEHNSQSTFRNLEALTNKNPHGLRTRTLAGDVEAHDLLPDDAVRHAVSIISNLERKKKSVASCRLKTDSFPKTRPECPTFSVRINKTSQLLIWKR